MRLIHACLICLVVSFIAVLPSTASAADDKSSTTSTAPAAATTPATPAADKKGGTKPGPDLSQAYSSGTLAYSIAVTDTDGEKNYCIPAKTKVIWWPSTDPDSTAVYLRLAVKDKNEEKAKDGDKAKEGDKAKDGDKDKGEVADCTPSTPDKPLPNLSKTQTYLADAGDLQASASSSQFVMGVLTIPYKYYAWGDRTFAGNSTVGGYVGWQWHYAGSDTNLTLAFIGGPSFVSVSPATPPTNAGSTNSENAITYGLGVFLSGGDGSKGQFGIAIGRDNVSKNVQWVNNEHGWIAFQIGFKFF